MIFRAIVHRNRPGTGAATDASSIRRPPVNYWPTQQLVTSTQSPDRWQDWHSEQKTWEVIRFAMVEIDPMRDGRDTAVNTLAISTDCRMHQRVLGHRENV
jgi:hypothetical protein